MKTLRRLRSNGAKPDQALSDREVVLSLALERAEAELHECASRNDERGRVFQKSRQKHDALKKEANTRKERLRELEREVKRLKLELDFKDQDIRVAHAAMEHVLARPGPQIDCPLVIPPTNAPGSKLWVRRSSRVWRYPMRLGVLRQHEPRPLKYETLPAPTASGATWPVITVATPSFNQGAFLERTMLSVLDQNYPALEYFVSDGGSKDGSVDIVKRHQKRLSGWVSEPDRGAAHAINRGLTSGSGEIMAWLNSDDLWVPGLLKFVAAWFSSHPEVDVVYGHRWLIDDRDNLVGRWTLPRHDGEMLLWADYVPQETMFWRRRIWEKTGAMLDESFRFAFDWELLLRFQRAGARIVRLPWFMGCFRVHEAQKSSADIRTIGLEDMKRLRERELGAAFNEKSLARHTIDFQARAILCDRLWRAGLRW